MRIANPMYDAVFKHLLEDPASAKLIVGAILGEEIESLEMAPQEAAVQVGSPQPAVPEGTSFTVLRVDFAATVRTAGGEHLRVLIEVQKARYSNDVMRFRRYLGMHYADQRNTVTYAEGGRERERPRRLTCSRRTKSWRRGSACTGRTWSNRKPSRNTRRSSRTTERPSWNSRRPSRSSRRPCRAGPNNRGATSRDRSVAATARRRRIALAAPPACNWRVVRATSRAQRDPDRAPPATAAIYGGSGR